MDSLRADPPVRGPVRPGGCPFLGADGEGIGEAVAAARDTDPRLPGRHEELPEALPATGTPRSWVAPWERGRQVERLAAGAGRVGGLADRGRRRLSVPLHNGSGRNSEVVQARPGERVVNPGDVVSITGAPRNVGYDRMMQPEITILPRHIAPQPRQGCDPIVVDNGFRG